MTLPRFLRTAVGAVALLAALPATASAAELNRAEVEKIVREYLLANPEILREMSLELQKRDQASAAEKAKTGIASAQQELLNDGYSYVAGNPNGDVTVVEFFDYRCGYCKRVTPDLLKLIEMDGNVRVVLKEFPILSETSKEASKAAMAALKQGGELYWKYHNAMLTADSLDSAAIYDIAGDVGLDVNRLKTDMADSSIEAQIAKTHELAEKIGVDGTPAFIIGDQLIPGAVSADALKAAVDAQRKGG